jgi:23S rRNA pseudouridine1911/1915/1917 synthase
MKIQIQKEITLIDALALLSPDSSKTTLRYWLKEGRVTVDGLVAKIATMQLKPNQTVSIGPKFGPTIDGMRIIYEDSDLVVVDKPSGLLSVAANFDKKRTAHALLKTHYKPNKVYVVHRIDQDTSGVMLFALSEEAYDKLKLVFEEHDIVREYIAIVEWPMAKAKGTWESYLYEDANYHVHETKEPGKGKLAITHYEVLAKSPKYSCVKFKLETGRKNQIRVQCAVAGHPIAGDFKYGAYSDHIRRLCLHAYKLAFEHPITGKMMHFESPLPAKFNKLISLSKINYA